MTMSTATRHHFKTQVYVGSITIRICFAARKCAVSSQKLNW